MNRSEPANPSMSAIRTRSAAYRMGNGDRDKRDDGEAPGTGVITRVKPQTKRPNLYRVLLLNDDYTPMEFVVHVLERFFGMDRNMATHVMLQVHTQGKAVCGVYPAQIAETKVAQVNDYARKHHHPLMSSLEEA